MEDISHLVVRDLKTAAEIALSGLIIVFEAAVFFGMVHYIAG